MLPTTREHKLYNSAHKRFLKPAIENFFKTEFPKSFGPSMRSFIADSLIKVFEENNREADTVKPGQVLWNAVHKDTRTGSPNMKLVPVILTLVCDEDISKLEKGLKVSEHKQNVIARLLEEAHRQGALLSMRDLSLLLVTSDSLISRNRKIFEKQKGKELPHLGNLQDVGRCLTHKYQIVYKCMVEKKAPLTVARETNHSMMAVDRYLKDFNRVKTLFLDNKDVGYINIVTGMSNNLIEQYIDIIKQYVKET